MKYPYSPSSPSSLSVGEHTQQPEQSNTRMPTKFTAIYIKAWMSGSHYQSITKMRRCEQKDGETVLDMLKREGVEDSVQFLFNGWPTLQGEIKAEIEFGDTSEKHESQ